MLIRKITALEGDTYSLEKLCQVSDLPISKLGRISRPVVTFEGVSYTKVVDNSKWNDTEGHG